MHTARKSKNDTDAFCMYVYHWIIRCLIQRYAYNIFKKLRDQILHLPTSDTILYHSKFLSHKLGCLSDG